MTTSQLVVLQVIDIIVAAAQSSSPSADNGGKNGKNEGELHDDCGDCER